MSRRPMQKEQIPDGGYGWIIVAAFGTNNIIVIPIMQNFSLLFRDVFKDLNMSATDISTIVNVNSAFGLILGLFNGPLFKKFSYRQVSLVSVILMFTGLLLTSTANSFHEFIMYYGVINSIGYSLNLTSFTLALNTYFSKRRNLATGFSSVVTGFGPVIMPILISFLISYYGVRGTAMILSALILHCMTGALLLHPVKWHYRKVEETTIEKELELLNPPLNETKTLKEEIEDEDEQDEDFDVDLVHGLEKVKIPAKKMENFDKARGSFFASKISLHEKAPDATWWRKESNAGLPTYNASQYSVKQEKKTKKKDSQQWISKIVKLFDLDLLQDPGYRIIWFGMSLAFTGEINFALMTPLILGDLGWSVGETATLMSSLAFADIIMRFFSPFIGDAVKLPAKQMYMISLVFLTITRSSLTFVSGWTQTLIACSIIGLAKGFRTVYMGLVIPSYVPLEKLASATGLQTVLNGLFLLAAGPILGFIRDKSGSYNPCIYFITSLSMMTIILWSIEMILNRHKVKDEANEEPTES
ncbi:monocarboxylate transporter 13 isoform X2 [Halyomorpha halys]|uniref:monocarboxylate transporter 13 isoform X2 n=1 Tax=Halyomorpha halys TaxID=286706 RepID=UPI0006D4DFBC|nr:monocarboxylate transporter 13 isoform X2 [Halyomorpha halys]